MDEPILARDVITPCLSSLALSLSRSFFFFLVAIPAASTSSIRSTCLFYNLDIGASFKNTSVLECPRSQPGMNCQFTSEGGWGALGGPTRRRVRAAHILLRRRGGDAAWMLVKLTQWRLLPYELGQVDVTPERRLSRLAPDSSFERRQLYKKGLEAIRVDLPDECKSCFFP